MTFYRTIYSRSGHGNIKVYRNDVLIGTVTPAMTYGQKFGFEVGQTMKMQAVPDAGYAFEKYCIDYPYNLKCSTVNPATETFTSTSSASGYRNYYFKLTSTITYGFNSSEESQNANINTLLISGNNIYFDIEIDSGSTPSLWFYASYTPQYSGTYYFTVKRLGQDPANTVFPVYSKDKINWTHVSSRTYGMTSTANYWIKFPIYIYSGQKMYFAMHRPYTISSNLNPYLNSISTSPYVSLSVIGQSVQNRNIVLVTVTNPFSTVSNKKKLLYVAGQHAMLEDTGAVNIEGIINWLINETAPLAQTVRDNAIIYFIPMANPDGVYKGNSRTNINYVDLNRDWANLTQPETIAMDNWILNNCCFDTMTDFHSWQNIWIEWLPYMYPLPEDQIRYDNIFNNLQQYVPYPYSRKRIADDPGTFKRECYLKGYGLSLTTEHKFNRNTFETGWHTFDSMRAEGVLTLKSQLKELGFTV